MAQDIIVDTTMKFIMSDEKNLALALQVEKAMPHVKEELIKGVRDGVKNRLEEKNKNKDWEVVPSTDENVFALQRKDWPNGSGINFRSYGLGVLLPSDIDVGKFKVMFEYYINQSTKKWNDEIYQERCWTAEENLIEAMRKDEMVTELTEQIKDWAIAVDKALGDLKEGGENRA